MHIMHFPLEPKTKPNEWKEGGLNWAFFYVGNADQWCRRSASAAVAAATRWRWAGAAHGPAPGSRKSHMIDMQVIFSGIVQEIGIICQKNTETL